MVKNIDTIIIGLLLILGFVCNFFNIHDNSAHKGIYYDNLKCTDNVIINKVAGVDIDYNASLKNVGDFYEINFDVVNDTGVDMKISDLIVNKDDKYITYKLTYDNGEIINNGDILKKGEKKSLKYKVSYLNTIDTNNYSFDSGFHIGYEQNI